MSIANGARSSAHQVLLQLLAAGSPRTRPELAEACGLSRPTVFAAVERLTAAGLVESVGQRSGLPGRSAAVYVVPPSAGSVAAIDIGGANLRVVISDLLGSPLAEVRKRTQARGGSAVAKQALELARQTIAGIDGEVAPLLAVAVSLPGAVDEKDDLVRYLWNIGEEEPYYFRTRDFKSKLVEGLGAPVLLDNNVNFAALGEQWKGVARDLSTFAVVAVGAGVGAGIVHNGQLLRGVHGAAGEVAFLPFGRNYPQITPPSEEPGATTLLRAAQGHAGWNGSPPESVEELFDRAATGEEPAAALVEEECRRIGAIIAAICAIVDPETVVLAGGVGSNAFLLSRAAQIARELAPVPPNVVSSALGERASLVGALSVALKHAHQLILDRLN